MSATYSCSQCGASGVLSDASNHEDQRCPACGGEIQATPSHIVLRPRKILGMSVPVFAVVAVVLLCAGVPLVLLPMIQSLRSTGHPIRSKENLKKIAFSLHNYAADDKDILPTEAHLYGAKKPLLSWRVHVLIHLDLEYGTLYDQFHLDEPWDSEHNKKLIEQMPGIYRSPTSDVGDEGKTVYLAVTGPGTAFERGKKVNLDVPDGMSSTIMVVEVSDERAVIWTKPDDWEFNPERPMDGLMGQRDDGFLVMTMDGETHLVKPDFDPETFKRLLLRNDGEPAQFDE